MQNWGERILFTPTIRNESLHQDSNYNGVRTVNFVTSENLVAKSTVFPHGNICKYTWNSPDGKTYTHIDHILIGDNIRVYSMYSLSGELTVILIISGGCKR